MDSSGLLGAEPKAATAVPVATAVPQQDPSAPFDPESVTVDQAPSAAELAEAVVWAESVRPAVIATPTKACSAWIVAAGLLQVALMVTLVLMLSSTEGADCAAWDSSHCATTHGCVWDHVGQGDSYLEFCNRVPEAGEAQDGYLAGIFFICLIMLVEICACPSARFLRNILQDGNAYQHVESVRKAPPAVRWHIQCYHYETRHYTETTTDSEGRRRTEHKTERVRRDTWSARYEYVPYYWEDISNPFPDIGTASLTRLTFSKQIAFADSASAQHFNRKKHEFIRMNRRDIHYDFHENLHVPGFAPNILACKDAGSLPAWLNQWGFYLASLCCLTVPYRMAFAKLCWEVPEYRYIKRFYSAPVAPIYCPFPVLTVCTAQMPTAQAVPMASATPVATAQPTAGAVVVDQVGYQTASAPPAALVPSAVAAPSPTPMAVPSPVPMAEPNQALKDTP